MRIQLWVNLQSHLLHDPAPPPSPRPSPPPASSDSLTRGALSQCALSGRQGCGQRGGGWSSSCLAAWEAGTTATAQARARDNTD